MPEPKTQTDREGEGLPEGIEDVAKELVQKALLEILEEADDDRAAVPDFSEAYPIAAEHLRKLVAESFGETRQEGPELEYVSEGAFCYDYGRVMIFNRLQRPACREVPVAERAIFLPHCLQNRKRCTAEELDLYDRCGQCGACAIANIVQMAQESGYDPERIFIVGGASVIPPIIDDVKPGAVAGVACMEELGMIIERIVSRYPMPPAQMSLLRRRGCRNTRADLADVKAMLQA